MGAAPAQALTDVVALGWRPTTGRRSRWRRKQMRSRSRPRWTPSVASSTWSSGRPLRPRHRRLPSPSLEQLRQRGTVLAYRRVAETSCRREAAQPGCWGRADGALLVNLRNREVNDMLLALTARS